MSNDESKGDSFAGSGPTERSEGGADPACASNPADGREPIVDHECVAPEPDGGSEFEVQPEPGPDPDERSAARLAARRPGVSDVPGAVLPDRRRKKAGRRLVSPEDAARANRKLNAEQRVLILDAWQRSGLPARDFATIAGVSHHTLYAWKRRFDEHGPAGLTDQSRTRGSTGSKMPEPTKRAILMLKHANPEWGCQRISDVLYRGPGIGASAKAVARVLKDAGYESELVETRTHAQPAHRFERAKPNQLWQTDLFTFVLKRQNRRVYLVAFMDDHSRFVVGYGLHASQLAGPVLEILNASIKSCGVPEEVLTDNGAQYVTWRGKSKFTKELEKRGVKQIVATPRKPRTLGKIERFWGTLWRECIESAIFVDLEDARTRIGLFIDHYNFRRPHQGIDGLTPADRFFGAAPQVLETLKTRVEANALELARNGRPKEPFYMTGQVGGKPFSVHAEGERVFMVGDDGERREVELTNPESVVRDAIAAEGTSDNALVDPHEPDRSVPGTSPLDEFTEGGDA